MGEVRWSMGEVRWSMGEVRWSMGEVRWSLTSASSVVLRGFGVVDICCLAIVGVMACVFFGVGMWV
jgi:hypothetical protein